MIDNELVVKLRERFNNIHPLIFHRSLERARSAGDLFDILDTVPNEYPIIWDESLRRWVATDDIFMLKNFVGDK